MVSIVKEKKMGKLRLSIKLHKVKVPTQAERNKQTAEQSVKNSMKADTNGDGIISAQELQSSGMQISVFGNTTFVGTQEEIDSFRVSEEFWQAVDPNDNGTVSLKELANSGLMLNLNANERNIVDTNKDGELSDQELKAAGLRKMFGAIVLYDKGKWQKTKDEAAEKQFNIFDTNKDGQLSVEEYQNMFNTLNQNQ